MKLVNNKTNKSTIVIAIGCIFILTSILLALNIFLPIIKEEVNYTKNLSKNKKMGSDEIMPIDSGFSIVIPKIGANSRIIQDVDPYDSATYQYALSQGVAHAKGSSLPGENGNIFLFAHSSDDLFNATRYNSVFYLINKLQDGDVFYIYKDNKKYEYEVTNKLIVAPNKVKYIEGETSKNQTTLMTCWPPGTTLNRLIVIGEEINNET